MQQPPSFLWPFLQSFWSAWYPWITLSAMAALPINIIERFRGTIPWQAYALFIVLGAQVSFFNIWRDERAQNAPLIASVSQLRGEKAKLAADRDELIKAIISKDRPIKIGHQGNTLKQRVLNLAFQMEKFYNNSHQLDPKDVASKFESKFMIQTNLILNDVSNDGINAEDERRFCAAVQDNSYVGGCINRIRDIAKLLQ